jgi:hypothetical protein
MTNDQFPKYNGGTGTGKTCLPQKREIEKKKASQVSSKSQIQLGKFP